MSDEKIDRKEYIQQRNNYDEQNTHQTDLLDKYILTISTGSFGVSFIFIDKIIKDQIIRPGILIFSWIMFVCSIISSLLSFLFSKIAAEKAIEEYDKMYKDEKYIFKNPIQDIFTTIFNYYALGFLIIGFISLISFSYYNLIGE